MSEKISKGLHRLKDNKNDWDDVPEAELNVWQRIAKKTKGILTPANTITVVSTAFVINGLIDFANGNYIEGTAKVAAGRAGDVADGGVAEITSTKGRVGRDLDPTADLVQMAVAVPVLVNEGVIHWSLAGAVAVPKIVDGVASVTARARGIELNPTKEGKKSIALIWMGLGALMLKTALYKHIPSFAETGLVVGGYTATGAGAIYHLPATQEYVETAFSASRPSSPDTPADLP